MESRGKPDAAAAPARTFDDLIIEVFIVRPGPIQVGRCIRICAGGRTGAGDVPSSQLELRRGDAGPTHFQEQVIRVAMALAGFTPGEADLMRRAMSRSRSAEQILWDITR